MLDSTALGVLAGGLMRVRPHDGSLDLVCSQERIFRVAGLTTVSGIYPTVDQAIAARKQAIAGGFARCRGNGRYLELLRHAAP